ncbi:hypothetical protein AKJ16_DCAP09442 [Drosera capensis]
MMPSQNDHTAYSQWEQDNDMLKSNYVHLQTPSPPLSHPSIPFAARPPATPSLQGTWAIADNFGLCNLARGRSRISVVCDFPVISQAPFIWHIEAYLCWIS